MDPLASQTNDSSGSYDSILKIYRRIEDWRGTPDLKRRGVSGPVFVQPLPAPSEISLAFMDAARSYGFPGYEDQNGEMMEGNGGCALPNVTIDSCAKQALHRACTSST